MAEHQMTCQCGDLSLRSDLDPDFTVVCNCGACQKRTGSAFATIAYFRKSGLVISGDHSSWGRTAASGRPLENYFCPNCGCTVYWTLELRPDHVGVLLGAFDTPKPTPERAIWTDDKVDWIRFPDGWPTYPTGSPGTE